MTRLIDADALLEWLAAAVEPHDYQSALPASWWEGYEDAHEQVRAHVLSLVESEQ